MNKDIRLPDTKDHAAVLIAEALVKIHKCLRWQACAVLATAIVLIIIVGVTILTN
tara:strand:- start:830 stop:994 length:165 start_codon:yes stop_codon:yes gene_type:complete